MVMAHTPSSSADSVHSYVPFDYEQWRRGHPRPAAKRLADRNVGEPRTVRMIYFLPNDRPYDAALVDLMKTRMRQIQAFYAEQMQAHGYGNRTFRFETDAAGEPLVHRVDGQHPNSYYQVLSYTEQAGLVRDEIERTFDLEKNIYFIVADAVVSNQVGVQIGRNGGFAFIPGRSLLDEPIAEHELGHAFGLNHDFRDGNYIMSYGGFGDWDELSVCSARFLAVQPYFNPNAVETSPPTIELTSSLVRTADATSVPIRIKVRDSDGLHQVVLFVGHPTGGVELKECRGLEGEKEAVVEFDYDGVIPSRKGSDFDSFRTQWLRIKAIDALGNVTFSERFELVLARESRAPISTFIGRERSQWCGLFFSPDGRPLALESSYALNIDATVELWDVATGESIFNLPPRGSVDAAAFSSDGRLLALEALDGTIELWDVSSRELHVATVPAHDHDFTLEEQNEEFPDDFVILLVSSLSFSPDGRLLASGGREDELVKLWDVSSGEHVATLSNDNRRRGSIVSVIFSPDGRLLALNPLNGTIELWDVSSGEHIATVDVHERGAQGDLSFSPDGRLLALGLRDGPVKLWDVSTGESVAILAGSAPVSFSPDGRLLASGSGFGGQAVKLWDVSTGESIAILAGHEGYVNVVSFSPDGRLLASGSGFGGQTDRAIRLWDMAEWTPIPHTLTKSSGDGQEGRAGATLAEPFVVSVLDQYGSALAGTVVSFSVTAGGGTLSSTTATTDANGRARSTLTLGPTPGPNTVTATVEGLEPETFTAIGQATTDSDGEEDEGEIAEDEDQQESEETTTTTVELEGIAVSHDSIRENDEQATVITLTVTLDKTAATDETITLSIVSPTQGKTAKRNEDFDATLPETLTIARGQRTGTAQLTLTPKDNTTADGDKAFAVQATSSSGHAALINIKIIDNDAAVEPQARLTPNPAEVQFSADDPAWKTFTVHTNLDSVLVRANPSGSDPALEVSGGQQAPTRDFCPAEGNDRPTRGRRDGWNLHVKACQVGQTKILLIDYDTGEVLQQYEINVEASTSASALTALNPSYPNPFNSETVLSYTLPTASDIRLEVFTLSGQRVAVLHKGFQVAGYHTIAMDASDLASGVYLYQLTTPEGRFTQKFTLLR